MKRSAARLAFFGLYALQHRGQESAGIATCHNGRMHVHKDMGLVRAGPPCEPTHVRTSTRPPSSWQVSQVFTEEAIRSLPGTAAIGHTRYSTAGGSISANAQPFVLETDLGQVAVAHNGQLTRQKALRTAVLRRGVGLFTHTDSEVIAQCMARAPQEATPDHPFLAHYFPEAGGWSGLAPTARGQPATSLSSPEQPAAAGGDAAAAEAKQDPAAVRVATPRGQDEVQVEVPAPGRGGGVLPHPDSPGDSFEFRLAALVGECEGAFAFTLLTGQALYGVRDRFGMRPLCIGACVEEGQVSYCLSSESCALGTVGYTLVREVMPGEIVRVDASGVTSWWALPAKQVAVPPALCVFEYVYFSRPDTVLEGQLVHTVRQRLGAQLALESPVPHADIVSGVPDSSLAAGIGFAGAAGKPYTEILCKNRYIGRTFIQPDQAMRDNAIKLKFNALAQNIAGKVVVLVDDSIVRGSTMRQMVPLLRRAGAAEVHIRVSSPPLRHPCFMGVDIGAPEELIAHRVGSVAHIAEYLGADSLAFLSHDGMMHAVTLGAEAQPLTAYTHTLHGAPASSPDPEALPRRRGEAPGEQGGPSTSTLTDVPLEQSGFPSELWGAAGTVRGICTPGDAAEAGGMGGWAVGGGYASSPPGPAMEGEAGDAAGAPPPRNTRGALAKPPPYLRTTARGHCTACFNGEYPLPLDDVSW